MTKPLPLPDALRGRSFTLSEAADLGISRSRLRAKDLRGPSRGIRSPVATKQELVSRCRPYVEITPGAVISHTTAAAIHSIPLPAHLLDEPFVHLSRPRPDSRPQRKHVVGHSLRLAAGDTAIVDGLPVTSVARTWLDLAGILQLDDLIAAGDFIVSEHQRSFGARRHPKIAYAVLARYLAERPGHRNRRMALKAYAEMRVGVDSPPETKVRLILSRAGLPAFAVNCAVLDEFGIPAIWADLGCREYRTCVEYDGSHHLTPEQQSRDIARDEAAAELGWKQVKLNKLDLGNGDLWVAAKVERALRAQGWAGVQRAPD